MDPQTTLSGISQIITSFADLCRVDPARHLIHLPALNRSLSAADIWAAHVRYAERLTRKGLGPGHLVVSAAGNHPASVSFLLACRTLDIALMPVDAGTTRPEILGLADRFSAAAMLLPSTLAGGADLDEAEAVELDAGLRLHRCSHSGPRRYPGVALLKLTSGSTGPAKAALTTESQFIADATQIVGAMGIQPSDTQIAVIPLSHSYGLGVLLTPLLLQGTAVVLRDSFVPQQLFADARQVGARIFPGVPFMFQYMLANPSTGAWPRSLERLISAGAPLAPSTLSEFHARYGVKIHSFYGTTETGGIAFDDSEAVEDVAAVGRALPGVTITLKHETGGSPGSGRIHVRSAAVADGYSDHACEGFSDGGFLTGDYGAWDARQRLRLVGRVSSFVNVAGRKVQPDEVEQALRTMPGVEDVRIVAAPDDKRGQQIVACIVANGTCGITPLTVRHFCAARLAPYKIPRTVIFLDAIPLTARGKTDRAALDDLVRATLPVSLISL